MPARPKRNQKEPPVKLFSLIVLTSLTLPAMAQLPSTCEIAGHDNRVQVDCEMDDDKYAIAISKETFNNSIEAAAFCRSAGMQLDPGFFELLYYFGLIMPPEGELFEEFSGYFEANYRVSSEILGRDRLLSWQPLSTDNMIHSANTLEEARELMVKKINETVEDEVKRNKFLADLEKADMALLFSRANYSGGSFSQHEIHLGTKVMRGELAELPQLHVVCISNDIEKILEN